METYSQHTTMGLWLHVTPQSLLHAHIRLWTLVLTCFLQVSRESRATLRYLTDLERCKVTPEKRDSKKPGWFIFLINTSSVFSGLTDSPISPHQVSAVWRAHCMSAYTVFRNIPTARRQCHQRYPEGIHRPSWASLPDQQRITTGAGT